ncbi:MAG: hypothetical protein Q9218_001666 [Villophora microphyllina]
MAPHSENWRTRINRPQEGDNMRTKGHPYHNSDRTYIQQKDRAARVKGHEQINSSQEKSSIRGEDDPRTLQAIAEGRRLYVGNLPYMAKTRDIECLFEGDGYQIEHINMSTDPYTGRNPSYCFVELKGSNMAEQAINELNGILVLGRPVKIGPGAARSKAKRPQDRSARDARPIFDRWTRTDVSDHWKGYANKDHKCRRIFIGGLPRMPDHHTVNEDVRHMFRHYQIEAVSKVIIPEFPAFYDRRTYNHQYFFVDFSTADEAQHAVKEFNGKMAWGVKICVQLSTSESRKIYERDEYEEEDRNHSGAVNSLPYD